MPAETDIVARVILKTGVTARYVFVKALQAQGKPMREDRFDEHCLAYRNHGIVPDFVTDYCIDVMREKTTL